MATREALAAEAKRRGLIAETDPQIYPGTISARPGFLERALPATGQLVGGVAGGLAGAAAGGIAAPAGAIGGATAGALAGRGIQQWLRMGRGEKLTPQQVGQELGTEALVTGASEAVFPVVGKALRPVVKPFAENVVKKSFRPGIENMLRFMTSITPENTQRVLEAGPSNVLTRKLRSREGGVRLAKEFLGNAQEATRLSNEKWRTVFGPLMRDTTNLIQGKGVRNAAQDVRLDFAGGSDPVLESAKDVFKSLRGVVGDIETLTKSGTMTVDEAVRARQQIDNLVYTGRRQGLLSESQVAGLKTIRKSLTDQIHVDYPQTATVDTQRHVLGEAIDVIERFSPEAVSDVSRMGKMIDAFEDIDPAVREALYAADEGIKRETGKSFIDSIRDRSAAKAFEPVELRAVRSWLITAVLGALGFGTGGPGGAIASTALGVGLSSPRLTGEILKAGERVGKGALKAAPFLRRGTELGAAEGGRQIFLNPVERR